MLRTLKILWPWLAAVATGVLAAICFPPVDQSWLCWVALTPLLAALWFSGENSRRLWLRNLLLGYVSGVVFFTIAFGWLGALGDLYDNFFLHSLSLLLSIYLALYFAFWSWFAALIRPANFVSSHRNLLTAMLAAAAWTTHEWIRGWLFSGFGWDGLGVALHRNWPLIQLSEYTGVVGLSFVVAFINVIAVCIPLRLFAEAQSHRMRPHFDLTLSMIGLVALFAAGLRTAQNDNQSKSLRVAAVEASVPQLEKFDARFISEVFDRFERLSEIALRANPAPDLLVWPESSMPEPVREETTQSYRFVKDFATSNKTDLLLGTLDAENDHEYNAALLVSNSGERIEVYRKIHLVPFGEYIPLRHSFPLFATIAGTWVPGDFARGAEYTVFNLTNPDVRVAPLICFEDTVGDLVRRFVGNGANLLVDITNDAWFLQSAGSRQHVVNALFRCVETRRPMVRAANTGVTCFVDESGRITQLLQDDTGSTFTQGVLTGVIEIPQSGRLTFYVRHGEWFAEICAVVTGVAILLTLFLRKKL